MPGQKVDGMDVLAVYESAREAIERARAGRGPTLLEYKTYRYMGHSRGDPGRYRQEKELETWRQRDPIELYHHRLVGEFGVAKEALEVIEESCQEEAEASIQAAQNAPAPSPEEVQRHVFAEGRGGK
jgi:TPP-dependent pyruvate/acetoin dehydrogenase alpha subunit